VFRATAARIRAFRGFWFNLEPWTRMESSPAAPDIRFYFGPAVSTFSRLIAFCASEDWGPWGRIFK
jgi:hypothetical protein